MVGKEEARESSPSFWVELSWEKFSEVVRPKNSSSMGVDRVKQLHVNKSKFKILVGSVQPHLKYLSYGSGVVRTVKRG